MHVANSQQKIKKNTKHKTQQKKKQVFKFGENGIPRSQWQFDGTQQFPRNQFQTICDLFPFVQTFPEMATSNINQTQANTEKNKNEANVGTIYDWDLYEIDCINNNMCDSHGLKQLQTLKKDNNSHSNSNQNAAKKQKPTFKVLSNEKNRTQIYLFTESNEFSNLSQNV